jgi:Xaa-Pro aminopeptidase
MLKNLDQEMAKRNLEGIVVYGDTTFGNPDLVYVAGGNLARGGIYIKRLDHEPLLLTSGLDIGTARRLGRVKRIKTFTEWGLENLTVKYGRENAYPHLITSILKSEGIHGNVTVSGRNDLSAGVYLVDELRKLGARVVGEISPTVLESTRETKSRTEVDEIRRVGKKTAEIVESVLKLLRDMKRKRGRLYLGKTRATVGEVKRLISSGLAQQDLIAPEGTIFAIGSSSADPHNAGIPTDQIREGRLIVFDIFPQASTGYWFDLTRSFVIGRADAKAKRLFESVSEAQNAGLDLLREGVTGEAAMLEACRVIERYGYRTVREIYEGKSKSTRSGFTHSLGHGVGLTIGERPYLSFLSKDPLKSGQVVTVEPGVYLPKYGGVRIEDTVAIKSKGIDNLASIDKELELT